MPSSRRSYAVRRQHPYARYGNAAYAMARTGYRVYKKARQVYDVGKRFYNQLPVFKSRPMSSSGGPTVAMRTLPARHRFKSSRGVLAGRVKRTKMTKSKADPFKKGIRYVSESNSIETQAEVIYLGQTTAPAYNVIRAMSYALTKYLMAKVAHYVVNWNDKIDDPTSVKTTAFLQYYATASSTTLLQTVIIDDVSKTYLDFATALEGKIILVHGFGTEAVLDSIVLLRSDTGAGAGLMENMTIPIRDLRFAYKAKCDMKIQNRTTSETGSEADQVDNIPLYGKIYYGKGTGPICKDLHRVGSVLVANQLNGIIIPPGSVPNSLLEPPPKYFFKNVQHVQKLALNPGEIKTISQTHSFTMGVNEVLKAVLPVGGGNSDIPNATQFGKFAMIGVEKILDCTSTSIILGYEIQIVSEAYITKPLVPVTAQLFLKYDI